ncbi:PHP domain-containing protein [Acetobacterium fimetarium]|uniref:PHP domain-containing protein n=1 Tax=Acetobacterium fimetarium TaxID=52691 RepID=A0ABR6WX83_9FIRM|nr:phosphatase [Acetobacterium fimetarium]MBC3804985.1 PHP domain-containing protein [Acetobacterium fimetarium]
MRNYVLDAHTHTLACGHAYSTVLELIDAAAKKNLELICITEHGSELPGAPTPLFFANLRVIPGKLNNVKVLKGIESNIMDTDGNTDIPRQYLDRMEIRSASLHTPTFKPKTKNENTSAVLGAIANPEVDFICHLGNPTYELDYEVILQDAKKHNTLIEINNGSFIVRKGSKPNCEWIANRCKELEIPVILGTDTHFATAIGDFTYADKVLDNVDFPDELIINLETSRLIKYLENKGRTLFVDPKKCAQDLFLKNDQTVIE